LRRTRCTATACLAESPPARHPPAVEGSADAAFSGTSFSAPASVTAGLCARLRDAADAKAAAGGKRTSPVGAQKPFCFRGGTAFASAADVVGSVSVSARIGPLRRTFARISSEYLSRSGHADVRPLKLGSFRLIRGPSGPAPAPGSASAHTSAPVSPSRRRTVSERDIKRFLFFPSSTKARAFANTERGLTFFHHPSRRVSASLFSSSSSNRASAEGKPHVLTPCARARSSLTNTLAAHAQEVGGFHTRPPSATISSNVPAGESSYLARYTPPSVYPKSSTSFKSAGTCFLASLDFTRFSWYRARPLKRQGASPSR
jgi:hypothetical protein